MNFGGLREQLQMDNIWYKINLFGRICDELFVIEKNIVENLGYFSLQVIFLIDHA